MAPSLCRIAGKPFLEVIPNEGLLEKMFVQKVAQKFFRQVWGNSGKNPLHPQKFACSYTCAIADVTNSDYTVMLRYYIQDNLSFIHLCCSRRYT